LLETPGTAILIIGYDDRAMAEVLGNLFSQACAAHPGHMSPPIAGGSGDTGRLPLLFPQEQQPAIAHRLCELRANVDRAERPCEH